MHFNIFLFLKIETQAVCVIFLYLMATPLLKRLLVPLSILKSIIFFLSFFFVKTEYSKLAFDTNSEFLNAESLKHNVSGKVEHETYPECFKDLKGNVD